MIDALWHGEKKPSNHTGYRLVHVVQNAYIPGFLVFGI